MLSKRQAAVRFPVLISVLISALMLPGLPALAQGDALPAGWYRLTPSQLDEPTPYSFEHQVLIQAPPELVFEILDRSDWGKWFADFESVEWTSPGPHQVGSTRTVTLRTLAVQERFLAWEPGRRFSFSIDAANQPLLERMLEDLRLEPVDQGRATRLSWRVGYAPSALMSVVHPIAGAYFKQMFRDNLIRLKHYSEQRQKFLVD